MVSSETPQYIDYTDSLEQEYIDSIYSKKITAKDMGIEDRPVVVAELTSGDINTGGLLNFNNKKVDTHNAYNGGTFIAPKSGFYQVINPMEYVADEIGGVGTGIYVNGARQLFTYSYTQDTGAICSTNTGYWCGYLEKGDTIYINIDSIDNVYCYVYGGAGRTQLNIIYLGAK